MIKKKEEHYLERVIDLTGPEGNAFCLLAYAKDFGRQLGWDQEKIDSLDTEMTSGDYENLVLVFDREFGSFVTLLR